MIKQPAHLEIVNCQSLENETKIASKRQRWTNATWNYQSLKNPERKINKRLSKRKMMYKYIDNLREKNTEIA